jgi:hypothetical protein
VGHRFGHHIPRFVSSQIWPFIPPPLASEFHTSYGEMSRRSGGLSAVARSAEVEAAKADIWIRQNRRPGLRAQRSNEMTDLVVDVSSIGDRFRNSLA